MSIRKTSQDFLFFFSFFYFGFEQLSAVLFCLFVFTMIQPYCHSIPKCPILEQNLGPLSEFEVKLSRIFPPEFLYQSNKLWISFNQSLTVLLSSILAHLNSSYLVLEQEF